jgi:hypothetical protein
VLTPPYFNIAEKRKVTANATCGEGVAQKEVYCKLVGYDSRDRFYKTSFPPKTFRANFHP